MPKIKLSWEFEPVKYHRFTDLGNYFIQLKDQDASAFEKVNPKILEMYCKTKIGCTATVKKNRKGEVIFGRNMDVEISQNAAYMTMIHGGKYETATFSYGGLNTVYRYDQCEAADQDEVICNLISFVPTDAMNEAGLYIQADMREMDNAYPIECTGTNPGKPRACVSSVAALVALNCATVPEAVEYINNSYSWCSSVALLENEIMTMNFGYLIGDAQGNYGLIEFGMNKVFFTPYPNGHANYYIHPSMAEFALTGAGYGRLAAALKGLPECETEEEMMENMKQAMWKRAILEPGSLGYSDYKNNLNYRRSKTQEELRDEIIKFLAPVKPLAEKFYAGDEKPLRDAGSVWTTSFNFGVNCAKKHLVLRLWENDNLTVDLQW